MSTPLKQALLGAILAIAITTIMDAAGLLSFSALPLCPLLALFWYLGRFSRAQVGFVWGQRRHYALALLHPITVIGLIVVIAAAAGVIDTAHTNWQKTWLNFLLVSVSTVLVAIVTEEGFFRGWLWACLERAGLGQRAVVICTSLVFSLWHLSAVVFDTGYNPPPAQIPVFMINAAVIGVIWGLLRGMSGSVLVTSLVHGIWNGAAYVFFGYGSRSGALGIESTTVFGPEVGLLGLGLNALFAVALWRWGARRRSSPVPTPAH
jgi:membrane protease YdiL (CAAX protease family)